MIVLRLYRDKLSLFKACKSIKGFIIFINNKIKYHILVKLVKQ